MHTNSIDNAILVCGGAGYIGSHTVRALLNHGYYPVVFDNLKKGHLASLPNDVPLLHHSLMDMESLRRAFLDYSFTGVFHFAAYIEVGESVISPELYYKNNVIGTMNLLAAMREASVRNLVFSSTAAVYGDPVAVPIVESHPLRPVNPYGRSKLFMEELMADYALAYKFNVTALRYFNAAGADPSAEIGESHDPESHIIPNILNSILDGKCELKIFGNDYDTPDGTCVRDYIHVCDLAEAHILALEHQRQHHGFFAFNLGNGQGFSILEVIAAAEKITGRKIDYTFHPRRPGDAARLVANSSLARASLNWKPNFTSLEDIVGTAWKWHLDPYY
jgi:UDP-glucose 4-epimerase